MNKNIKTYLLLAIVIAVWGVVGYTIIAGLFPAKEEISIVDEKPTFKLKPFKKRDTFSIVANYRDPFLGKLPIIKKNRKIKVIKKSTVQEPVIGYTGYIGASSSKEKMFFISINGKQHLMRVKDKIGDIILLGGTAEKIKVRYGKKTKNISLQK